MSDILDIKKKEIDERENIYKGEKINRKNEEIKKKNGLIIGLSIATAVLAASTVGFGIGFGISQNNAMQYKNNLESVYNSNFYSMLDSVNNLENKISKTLSSSSSNYQRKILLEASKNASEAEIAVSSLPLSQSDINDTIKLVNQISGYTSTLAENLAKGQSLTSQELNTLNEIDQSLLQLKKQLNDFARKLNQGVSIFDSSFNIDNNSNEFTKMLSLSNNDNVEYPTMIYDGPFSDSVINSSIKGLKGNKISKTEAMKNVEKCLKNTTDITFESETKGKFETYNFRVKNAHDEMLYVQVTMIEGHILTISGAGADGENSVDEDGAKSIALDFTKNNGIENGEVVWSDRIGSDIYMNIAPVQNDIVLYPDLVKVKIDMASGTVVGYDATAYFTNHIERTLSKGNLSLTTGENKVSNDYKINKTRYVLTPLDYNREVVCVEVEATKDENTYYFYYNVQDGSLENILKVIKTDNGNLLM